MKKLLLTTSTLLAIALAMPVEANKTDRAEIAQPYDKMKKQINIMSNIIKTAMSDGQSKRSRGATIKGIYLKDQGVVFNIDNARLRGFDHFNVDLSSLGLGDMAPIAPIAPVAPVVIGDSEYEFINEDQIERAAEAYEQVIEAFREQSEHARRLREEQRELAYDMRNLSRRKRDMEFELRHANRDGDDQSDVKQDLVKLEEQLNRLKSKSEQLNERAKKEEKALREQKQQRKTKADKARASYYQNLDNTIAQTLCDYGAGLRQLSKNEHVTFVISLGAGDKNGADKKVHTFKKKDIVSCVLEDKTPQELIKGAQSYYF